MLKVVVSCSLLANAVLSVLLFANPIAAVRPSAAEPDLEASSVGLEGRVANAVHAGVDSEYLLLLGIGLSDFEAKTLVRLRLERTAVGGLEPPDDRYWESGAEVRVAHALAVHRAHDNVREALKRRFGAAAERDPAFAASFRPLDPYLSFLTSAEQVALQRFRLERQIETLLEGRVSPLATAGPVHIAVGSAARQGAGEGLESILGPESLLEYELRESGLAHELRAARLDLDEATFREAFSLLRAGDRPGVGTSELIETRRALQRLLSSRGYLRFSAGRDPLFRSLCEGGRAHDLSDETCFEAYAAIAALEEGLLEAAAAGADGAMLAARTRELAAQLEQRLVDIAGEEAARALLDVYRRRPLRAFEPELGSRAPP